MKKKSGPQAATDLLSQFVTGMRDKFETDEKLELEKGVDVTVDGYGTFVLLRAHSRNKKYVEAYRNTVTPYAESAAAKAREKAKQDDPILIDLIRDVFAETIVIGLKTADGQSIPYDDKAKAAVKNLLKATPDLYLLLQSDSMNAENFRKNIETEEKN